ncbi:S1 RNA-binding domain-containing protein [Streptomyces sp. NPDC059785]|uniref:S1 RNA-binding domain-containing protein n=1 Tax=unclassified Streptomyces TaxID=2593676 RepID=UPI00366A05E3
MAISGTDAYDRTEEPFPPLVRRAVAAARRAGFQHSCRPEQGRLLHLLARGAQRRIGETGTGCGVGLAWLASGAPEGVPLVSVERNRERAGIAAEVFAGHPAVRVVHGDWQRIGDHGPYDLLVLDGGGHGKEHDARTAGLFPLLSPGGTVVIDDFTPATSWPPLHHGVPDRARLHWLGHPLLYSTEVRLAPDLSTVVGTRRPPAADRLHALERGQICRGVITHTPRFGVFVDLDGIEGFIRVPELTWRHVNSVDEVVRVGQEITAQVLDIDVERQQVQLSLRALEPDPLAGLARDGLGRVLRGAVTHLAPFGTFVQVAEGLQGLLPNDAFTHLPAAPRIGDELTVEIVGINLVLRRISLALV